MNKIEIYTADYCSFCTTAKTLLDRKGLTYIEIKVDADDDKRDEMIKRSGGKRTVPQIFINDLSIGGSDDLYALERSGKLDQLLNR